MKQISLDELKCIQLEILDTVTKFCDEHGIKYWLNAGTLLGAIRHKGYIPWDDDIDLGMLRPDYDRFMKEFNGTYPRYECHCLENDPDFCFEFGKVYDNHTVLYEPDETGIKIAVYIDIFVFDNAPDDAAQCRRMIRNQIIYQILNAARIRPIHAKPNGNIIRRLLVYIIRTAVHMIPYSVLPMNYFAVKTTENAKKFMHEDTKRIGDFTGQHRVTWSKDVLRSFIDVEFEGRKYKAPVGYDEWLRGLYGNYMQLPPEKARVSRHNFKAYWIHE